MKEEALLARVAVMPIDEGTAQRIRQRIAHDFARVS